MAYTEVIYFFGMNMPFIPSSEGNNAYLLVAKKMKALYDVIHVRTLFHINDDVALYAMLAKTENAGEKKSENFSKSRTFY